MTSLETKNKKTEQTRKRVNKFSSGVKLEILEENKLPKYFPNTQKVLKQTKTYLEHIKQISSK